MKTPIRPKLKDLQVGDKFFFANKPKRENRIYEVAGKTIHQTGIGSHPTRDCKNVSTGVIESYCCTSEVIKCSYCIDCGTRVPEGHQYCWYCCEDGSDY